MPLSSAVRVVLDLLVAEDPGPHVEVGQLAGEVSVAVGGLQLGGVAPIEAARAQNEAAVA